MSGYLYDDAPTQLRTRATYEVGLIRKLPALASRALGNMEAVRFATASREVCIGTNRRELDDEGDIIGGENPTGPVDHEVRVIRFDDLLGKPTPVVFAHGCHTVTMGPNYLEWSPDYFGPARQLIAGSVGCLSLFLQASAGDIDPITGIGADMDNTDAKNRLGLTLGGGSTQGLLESLHRFDTWAANRLPHACKGVGVPASAIGAGAGVPDFRLRATCRTAHAGLPNP